MKKLLVLALLLWATPAHAEKVGVLGLDAEAGSEQVAKWATKALRRWVRARGKQLGPEKTLTETKLVFGCDRERPKCMLNVARTMGVSTLVWGRVRRRGGQYVISLKALRVSRPGSVDTASHRIPIRGATQTAIRRLAGGWAAALIGGVTTGTLAVSGRPRGAVVWVDGKEVGPLPSSGSMNLDVQPGTHTVRLVKDGYVARSVTVRVRLGATSRIRLVLKAAAGARVRPVTRVPARVVKVQPEEVHKTYLPRQTEGSETQTPEKKSDPRKKWQIAFYVAAGVAAAIFIGGAVEGIRMLVFKKDTEDKYGRSVTGEKEGDEVDVCTHGSGAGLKAACDRGKKLATIANALYGTSAVFAVAAGIMSYWAFFKKYDETETQTGHEDATASKLHFTPMLGRVNGLRFQLEF